MTKIDYDKLQKQVADKNWIDGKKVKNYLGKNSNMGKRKKGERK